MIIKSNLVVNTVTIIAAVIEAIRVSTENKWGELQAHGANTTFVDERFHLDLKEICESGRETTELTRRRKPGAPKSNSLARMAFLKPSLALKTTIATPFG